MIKALALSVLVLAGIASLSAQDGAIGTTGGPSISFAGCMYYQHANFGGSRGSIPGGINRDFNGAHQTFRGNIQFVGEAWNDDVSSLVARCNR